jgi:hypothetical protein
MELLILLAFKNEIASELKAPRNDGKSLFLLSLSLRA